MKFIKRFILINCDVFLYILNKIRDLVRPGPEDTTEETLQLYTELTSTLFPYDLVMDQAVYQSNLNKIEQGSMDDLQLKWGSTFNIGVVVGLAFDKTNPSRPKYVTVAHFNTAEFNKPVLKNHQPEQLVILDSPIRSIHTAAAMSAAIESLKKDLNGGDAKDEFLSTKDDIESILFSKPKKGDKIN